MSQLDPISAANLARCHPDLITLFNEVVLHFPCRITTGHRGEEDQNKAFADGLSKLKWPNGKHNGVPSLAVDAYPEPIDFKDVDRIRYFAGVVKGIALILKEHGQMKYAVRWGGDWNGDTQTRDNQFNDLGHFELIIK